MTIVFVQRYDYAAASSCRAFSVNTTLRATAMARMRFKAG
jgi:hypothetical protein